MLKSFTIILSLCISYAYAGGKTRRGNGGGNRGLNAKDLQLRSDLLDVATVYFQALKDMATIGDLDAFTDFAYNTLTDDFVFPSDLSGVTYNGLDEYLHPEAGFYVRIIGNWDVVTTIVGSNIRYEVIDDKTVEMEVDVRTRISREECPEGSNTREIIEEEINKITFKLQKDKSFKISSVISQGGKTDFSQCEAA